MNKTIFFMLMSFFAIPNVERYQEASFYDLGTPFHFSSYYPYPYIDPRINDARTRFWLYNS